MHCARHVYCVYTLCSDVIGCAQVQRAPYGLSYENNHIQESPANAKGTRDSSACMKAHCLQM